MKFTVFAAASAVALLAGGCANDGSTIGSSLTTSSVDQQAKAAQQPKIDPACVQLSARIDTLRKEGFVERVEKASTGATPTVQVKRASLAKMTELDKANAEFQTKCSTLPAPPPAVQAQSPAGTPGPAAQTAAPAAPAKPKAEKKAAQAAPAAAAAAATATAASAPAGQAADAAKKAAAEAPAAAAGQAVKAAATAAAAAAPAAAAAAPAAVTAAPGTAVTPAPGTAVAPAAAPAGVPMGNP